MSDDQIRRALEQIAEPPSDTSGVANSVISQIQSTPPPPPGGAATAGGATWPWVTAAVITVIVAVGVGMFLGSRSAADETVEATAGTSSSSTVVTTYACPGDDESGTLNRGDRILAVAQSDDGAWVAVRHPDDLGAHAWVRSTAITPDGELDGLPTGSCDQHGELAIVSISGEAALTDLDSTVTTADPARPTTTLAGETAAGPSVSAPIQSPGPAKPVPVPPPTGPAPTQPPDNGGPSLSLSLSEDELWEADGGGISCGSFPRTSELTAQVSDPSGVADVRATWTAGSYSGDETLAGGDSRTATVGPHPYHSIPSLDDEIVTISVTARDALGNSTVKTIQFRLHSTDLCFG